VRNLTNKQYWPDVTLIQTDQTTLEMVSSKRLGISDMTRDTHVFSVGGCDISAVNLNQNIITVWVGVLLVGIKYFPVRINEFLTAKDNRNPEVFRDGTGSLTVEKQDLLLDMGRFIVRCLQNFCDDIVVGLPLPARRNIECFFASEKQGK
jgi:hypothetical protein